MVVNRGKGPNREIVCEIGFSGELFDINFKLNNRFLNLDFLGI